MAYINRTRDQVHMTLTQSRDFLGHSKATLKIHANFKAPFTWKEDDPRIQNVSDNFQEAQDELCDNQPSPKKGKTD